MKKTIADQIKDLENTRAAKAARMEEVSTKALDDGRTMDEAESEEFDTLDSEVKAVDADIARFRKLEAIQAAKAQPIVPKNQNGGAPLVFIPKSDPEDKFPGQSFVRRLIAKAVARDQGTTAAEVARHRWGKTHPTLVEVIKSGVAGGDIQSGDWGAELVSADNRYTGDFIEYLYSMTVYDKLGLREVPANVAIKGQDGTATGNWIGSGLGIKVSAQDYSTVSLTPLKVAAMSVVTKELLRYSSPSAEALVRDSLVQSSSQVIDTTFLSTTAASSTVSPAGILNGLSSLGSNGYTADALRADVKELYAPFITAKYDLSGLTFVMHPSLAKAISLLTNAFGQQEFPGLNANGGTLLGDRVVTGHNVGATNIILLDPRNIWRIGDMGVEVSMSDQATIEQDGAPAGDSENPTAASATLMSMFGQDSVAFKVVRPVNFQKRRSTAVTFIGDAQYGDSTSTTA